MSVVVLVQLMFGQSRWRDLMSVFFLTLLGNTISQSSCTLFKNDSRDIGVGVFCRCIHGD